MLHRLRRNFGIETVVCLAAMVLAWAYGVRPIAERAAETSARVDQLERSIAVHSSRSSGRPVSAAALESRVEASKADLLSRGQVPPNTRDLYDRLSELAETTGVRIDHVEPGEPSQGGSRVRTFSYRVRCTGGYQAVAAFAQAVVDGPGASGYCRLSLITLRRDDDGSIECSFEVVSLHPALQTEEGMPA